MFRTFSLAVLVAALSPLVLAGSPQRSATSPVPPGQAENAVASHDEDRQRLRRVQQRLWDLAKEPGATPQRSQPATLDVGGSISGRITASDTGLPLAGVAVMILSTNQADGSSAMTDADGFYRSFDTLPTGEYWVRVFAGDIGYLDEGYDDIPCDHHCSIPLGVKAVPVTVGQETPDIDFVLDPGGKVAGHVTDATTGLPVPGLFVDIVIRPGSSPFFYEDSGFTDDSGAYQTFFVVAPGEYVARTSLGSEQEAYIDELYQEIDCFPGCDLSLGTPIKVAGGLTTTGIDFTPRRGGTVAGRVVDRRGGEPLEGIDVTVYDAEGQFLENTRTAPDGTYRTRKGLLSGPYHLVARDERFPLQTQVDRIYGGPVCFPEDCDPTAGLPVRVTVGRQKQGINFRLEEGGRIAGNVTDASTGDALGYPTAVFFYAWPSLEARDGVFANNGRYVGQQALPKGRYQVLAVSPDHLDELFDDVVCEPGCNANQGERVKIRRGETTDGIDFALNPQP